MCVTSPKIYECRAHRNDQDLVSVYTLGRSVRMTDVLEKVQGTLSDNYYKHISN